MASKVFFLLFICLFSSSLAGTVQWTGAAGNSLWSFANNWLGNAVPTTGDDVVINALGGASVSVSQPAVARSITIDGRSYAQSLTLLSSLTVGAGGITVQQGGTLQVSSNNNLPLASTGAVTFASGSNFVFQSGAITGPGEYMVSTGAVLTFSQSALKLITAATVNVSGTINIQGSTIQLDSNAVLINNGNATAIGAVTFLSTDASANLFESNGGFVYQGQLTTALTFQTPTFFSAPLTIAGGDVAVNSNFTSKSTVEIPTGSTLKVGAGTGAKNFNSLKGTGILSVAGTAIINSPVSLSVFEITDSGSLTFNAAASFASCEVGGVLNAMAVVSVTNLTLAGGTLTGTGSTAVTGTLLIQSSDTGNTNNFISSILTLYGTGTATTAVYLLLGQGGQFHIAAGATFNILNTFTFGIQSGKPLVIVDGTVSVTQTAGQTFTSNVDFTSSGAGSLKVNSGTLTFNGDIVTLGTLFLAQPAAAVLNTVVATIGAVTGAGSLNLTAAPSPVSSLTTVAVSNLNVLNGNVNIGSLAVNNWGFWSGQVTLASGSSNSASNFNLYGGSLIGAAKLSLSAFNIVLNFPVTLNGVAIKTGSYSLQAPAGSGSLQITNGATIIAVAMSETVSRGNVNIN